MPRFRFTNDLILHAIRLHEAGGLEWWEVADRLGCPQSSLETTVSEYRTGRRRNREMVSRERSRIVEAGIEAGLSTDEMAAQAGVCRAAIQTRIAAMGHDRYTRAPGIRRRAAMESGGLDSCRDADRNSQDVRSSKRRSSVQSICEMPRIWTGT